MKTLDELDLDTADLVRTLALARIAFGATAFLAPRRFGKAWTGETTHDVTASIAMRSLGARDVALGLGALLALERGTKVRGWLEAGALADAADVVSTLSDFSSLGRIRRWLSLATAGSATYLGLALAEAIEPD